ncbi:MAG: hypothetical protein ABIJ50_00095 [Pseudomonadota bacterium]
MQRGGTGEDLGATGDLDITGTLSLAGAGVGQTIINGNQNDRVFDIHAGASGVLISNLTISHGQTSDTNSSGRGGGGVRNRGNMRLLQATVTDNGAVGGRDLASSDGNLAGDAECLGGCRPAALFPMNYKRGPARN